MKKYHPLKEEENRFHDYLYILEILGIPKF